MSHVATNKVKGDFYCPGYFLLFVLVSFMGLFRIPNNRPNRVPRFAQEISVVDQYWLQPKKCARVFNISSVETFFFSPEEQKWLRLWECTIVSGIESVTFSNYRKDYWWGDFTQRWITLEADRRSGCALFSQSISKPIIYRSDNYWFRLCVCKRACVRVRGMSKSHQDGWKWSTSVFFVFFYYCCCYCNLAKMFVRNIESM